MMLVGAGGEPLRCNGRNMVLVKVAGLFALTAVAEIVGCYLPWLVLRQGRSLWLLVPAALSLALFAWLLTLHPTAAGRTYAAYGGIYIIASILWIWFAEGARPDRWDMIGACTAFVGTCIILFGPRS